MTGSDAKRRFERLVRPEIGALLRTAGRMVGNRTVAEDLVQEVCLKAYAGFDPANEPTRFRAWLFRILVNQVIDWHRRRRSGVRAVTVEADGIDTVADPSPAAHPDVQLEGREIGHALERAIDALSPEHRAVVVLVLIEEMSYAEAAESLSISADLVRSRLSRARSQLRRDLAEHAGQTRAERARPEHTARLPLDPPNKGGRP